MIKHIWSILCRRTIIDSDTNNLTISDVLEELKVDIKVQQKDADKLKLINIPLEFEIVSLWKKEDRNQHQKADSTIEVISPDGKLMKTFSQIVEMPVGMKRLRSRMKVMGFAIENEGEYIFKINIKEEGNKMYKTVAELPFEVHLNKEIVSELPKP